MAGDRVEVRVDGDTNFRLALAKAEGTLRRELDAGLKDIAVEVATRARGIAESKGLRITGDMIRAIQPYAARGVAGVSSTSEHRNFPYPRRLEFEDRGGASYGPRASLYPAVDASLGEISHAMERVLDRVEEDLDRKGPR